MRAICGLLLIGLALTITGCGGGDGGTTPGTLAQSPDGKVAILGSSAALPAGVTLSVESKQGAELVPDASGSAFVAGAKALPAGTVFSQPVTLRFTLSSPLAAGDEVDLFHVVSGDWEQVLDATPSISADRLLVSFQIDRISADGQFALLKIGP